MVRRPVTAFFAKKSAQIKQVGNYTNTEGFSLSNTMKGFNAPHSSYNVDEQTQQAQSYGTGFYLSARNNKTQKSINVVSDPEGLEALNAIDEFENKNSKKPNRYPKASLETHLNLNDTMQKKINQRAELTQNKMQQNFMK